ncbi:hypothetical protein ABZS66_17015 [Dactylosporangium sp. NPDC005572]|uniref:hypothetical protein n=1 Tax=Dactylosporangium sp. NPDC005572 TaxID=3156889 RepID=UPI0033BD160A
MISNFARGVARGALTLAVTAGTVVGAASAAQAAEATAGKLSISALSFAQPTVNSTAGAVADDLTFTVKNQNQHATTVVGHVTIRMHDVAQNAYIGHEQVVQFSYGNTCCGPVRYVSGTPQESTYTYTFVVPQYASSSAVTWDVTKITLDDGIGDSATFGAAKLQPFGASIATTALPDTSGPSLQSVSLYQNSAPMRPFVYVGAGSAEVVYSFDVQDWQSGFWKGRIKLAGPAGQSVTTQFEYTTSDWSTGASCGIFSGGSAPYQFQCGIVSTLPAGAAAGNWRVAQITLFSNSGAQSTYKNPQSQSVTVTSDTTLSASGFSVSPNPVDNWRNDVTSTLTFTVTGATKGISAVYVDTDNGCPQWGAASVAADGTVSVPLRMYTSSDGCTITGIAIVDGAANAAVYGSRYLNAPDPGLSISRIPDTTPPHATSATLSQTSVPFSQLSSTYVQLTIHADILTAPINGVGYYMYDANGNVVSQAFGGTGQLADGSVTTSLWLPYWQLTPGVYTIGFDLTDAGGLRSFYGLIGDPRSQPVPGGPLVFTITDDSAAA